MRDEILTVEEAAQYLKVDPVTIRNVIRRGELQALRVGRVYRIRRVDLDDLLMKIEPGQTK
jgi:excisionase family DNA binding protein